MRHLHSEVADAITCLWYGGAIGMRQLQHTGDTREITNQMVHVVGRSQRAQRQLDQHPDASVQEKNSLGLLLVSERCVSSAVHGREEGVCSGHNHGQRNDIFCRKNQPTLKPDAKIRCATESNVKTLSVLCRVLAPEQDHNKGPGGVLADNYSPHTGIYHRTPRNLREVRATLSWCKRHLILVVNRTPSHVTFSRVSPHSLQCRT